MSPPDVTATSRERRNTSAVAPDDLIRDANLLMQACGLVRSRSWVSRTVRTYLRSTVRGLPFGQVLASELELNARQRADMMARSEFRYVLEYRDPTGETAVARVMRERGLR